MRRTLTAVFLAFVCAATPSAGWREPDRSVRVVVREPVDLTVEWLELTPAGEVRVTEARTARVNASLLVPVVEDASRFVRFSRPGASPVTVPAADLLREPQWTLPDPRPGGELAAFIEPAPVLPTSYRLSGPTPVTIDATGRSFVSAVGLPEGAYELLPMYQGDILGEKAQVSIAHATSTTILRKAADVGGAVVTAGPGVCAPDSFFMIRRLFLASLAGIPSFNSETSPDNRGCTWAVGGLLPGRYEATLSGAQHSTRIEFDVVTQIVTPVALPAPSVIVSGRVTYNGRPMVRASLQWALGGTGVGTATDANGEYRGTLAAPGEYVVMLSSEPVTSAVTRVVLAEGPNTFDWALTGGALTIRVHGWNQASPVSIDVRSANSVGSHTLKPGDEPVVENAEYKLGTYVVSAYQEGVDLLTRQKKTVTLDERNPEQTVDLDLVPGRVRLILRDAAGRPIAGARVRDLSRTGFDFARMGFLDEIEPGTFRLDGIDAGAVLQIKPPSGWAPACRTMPAADTLEVTLARGRRADVQLPPGEDYLTSRLGALVELEGSDCPVALTEFSSRKVPTPPGQPARYVLEDFPTARTLVLEIDGRREQIAAPEGGPIVLRR